MTQGNGSSSHVDTGIVWRDILETMSSLQSEMESLAAGRPLDQAEGTRYLARLLEYGLAKFNGHPTAAIDYATPRIGGFNPDYLFGHALINSTCVYRLRGKLNDVHRLALGTYTSPFGTARPVGYLSNDQLHCDEEGRFEIDISDVDPASGPRQNWLQKSSQTTSLMVRQLLLHATDRPAELQLEAIERPELAAPRLLTGDHQRGNMGAVLLFVAGAAGRFFDWTRIISQISNTIEQVPAAITNEVKADPDTFYALGYFDLADDERLEVCLTPPQCDYWGLQLTNHWLEPIEHDALLCHRNHANSAADADGSVTLSISAYDDGRRNTLHTLGHGNGAIFFRVIGAAKASVALPRCTVCKR